MKLNCCSKIVLTKRIYEIWPSIPKKTVWCCIYLGNLCCWKLNGYLWLVCVHECVSVTRGRFGKLNTKIFNFWVQCSGKNCIHSTSTYWTRENLTEPNTEVLNRGWRWRWGGARAGVGDGWEWFFLWIMPSIASYHRIVAYRIASYRNWMGFVLFSLSNWLNYFTTINYRLFAKSDEGRDSKRDRGREWMRNTYSIMNE